MSPDSLYFILYSLRCVVSFYALFTFKKGSTAGSNPCI